MGTIRARRQLRKPHNATPPCPLPQPQKVFAEPSLPVEDASLPTPDSMRLRTTFSHNPSALHSPFPHPCGSRGKPGSLHHLSTPVFQNSRIAQPSFGKLRTYPTSLPSITSEAFPLFHAELRVLLSFSLISYPFPTTRRMPFACSSPRTQKPLPPCASTAYPRQILLFPVIQTTAPVFHAHTNARMNTIKK